MKRIFALGMLLLLMLSFAGCSKGYVAASVYTVSPDGEAGDKVGVIRSNENKRLKVLTDMLEDCTTELGSPDLSEVAYLIEVTTHDSQGNITDPSRIFLWFREGEIWFSVGSKYSDMEYLHKSNAVTEKKLTALFEKIAKEYTGG